MSGLWSGGLGSGAVTYFSILTTQVYSLNRTKEDCGRWGRNVSMLEFMSNDTKSQYYREQTGLGE